jgi:hypothetical protein
VAELHPDRAGPQPASVSQRLALPELIALYTAAIHFHRQYGRLPGGLRVRNVTDMSSPRTTATRRVRPTTPEPAHEHEDEPKLPFARTLIIAILLIALLLVLQSSWDRLALNVDDEFTRTPVGIVPESIPAAAPQADARPDMITVVPSLAEPQPTIAGAPPLEQDVGESPGTNVP